MTGPSQVHLLIGAALLAASVAGVHAAAPGPEALTYEEARTALYQVSDARAAAQAGLDRSGDEAKASRLLGFPGLTIGATELFGEKTGAITNTPFGNIPYSENFHGPRSSVDSTWSIYSGGRISATQKTLASGVNAAQADLARTESSLDVLLTREYFGLELAANVEATRSAVLDQAERQLARAIRFEQQGLIPRVERLSAQVARDTAQREQVSAVRDREIAEVSLRRLLHRDRPLTTGTQLFVLSEPLEPIERWLEWAEARNPELAVLAARRSQAEQGVRTAEASWKPEIFAFGSYSLIRRYQTLIEPDWIAGVGVRLTLVAHVDRVHQVSAARKSLSQVSALEAAASTDIGIRVEAAYRKVAQAREQFRLLDSSIALAEENLRLRERGFGEGQSTTLDVSEARDAVARARTARAAAAFDFDVALTELLEAAGKTASLAEYMQRSDIRVTP
jgi:outer membrane protein TolC